MIGAPAFFVYAAGDAVAKGIYGDPCSGGDFGLETAQYCKITEKK
jgi:hypothetical protein